MKQSIAIKLNKNTLNEYLVKVVAFSGILISKYDKIKAKEKDWL
jgi:hypothetical protein